MRLELGMEGGRPTGWSGEHSVTEQLTCIARSQRRQLWGRASREAKGCAEALSQERAA